LLALLGTHHILHVSTIRIKTVNGDDDDDVVDVEVTVLPAAYKSTAFCVDLIFVTLRIHVFCDVMDMPSSM